VILHGYEEYGDHVAKHLDGMFAFAIWDEKKSRLLLARDRTGKKPLFYSHKGHVFTFASEIKSIVVCPWIERRVRVSCISEYLTYGYVSAPNTMYEGVQQVPPASVLVVERRGLKGPERYWGINLNGTRDGTEKDESEVISNTKRIMSEAVKKRLVSEVPLGALLSGGLDSTIVVGLMSKALTRPVRTFSIGFEGLSSFDERRYAKAASEYYGTEHTEFVVDMDAAGLMERLLWHHDQPYGDSAAIPTYIVSRLARAHVTVALNGDGADEVFAGYERFRAALLLDKLPDSTVSLAGLFARFLPMGYGYFSLKRRLQRLAGDAGTNDAFLRYINWIRIFNEDMLKEVFKQASGSPALEPVSGKDRPLLDRLLEFNFNYYLPYDLNVKMDRMSMACSLETRSPFLDTALIEYAASLPSRYKIRRLKTKYILRKAFADEVPQEILKRSKHGFGMPLGLWFKGGLGDLFSELVLSGAGRSSMYLDTGVLRRMYEEHGASAVDHGYRLWTVLQLELWLRMLERPAGWMPSKEITEISADGHELQSHSCNTYI
jgi:asparagine synthase (glutamine-hydrolysing)